MTDRKTLAARTAHLALTLLASIGTAVAAPVITGSTSTNELAYAGDVSASDLLHGKTVSASGWNPTGGSTAALHDGVHGRSFAAAGNTVEGSWTMVGATATYHLGTGAGGMGWDITSIQTIATWVNANFGNQGYTVAVKAPGSTVFVPVATVDYQPITNNAPGATKVVITDPTGIVATGVESIRFTAHQVNGGTNGGAFVFREIDVFGQATAPDTDAPILSTVSPPDDTAGVLAGTALVMTFNERVKVGTGNITLKNLSAASQTVIPVGDEQISIDGAVLTIRPAANLAPLSAFAVQIDSTAVLDITGNAFAGINDETTWNFTTAEADVTAPAAISFSPLDDASGVPVESNLAVTFDEEIRLGTGNITLKNLSNLSQTVIEIGSSQVSVAGPVLTVDPTNDLIGKHQYAIHIDATAIVDVSGNSFAGIGEDTAWNFTTAVRPLRIMPMGDSITAGYTDNPGWANHPFMFGYRSGLYTRLTDANYPFKFVGGSTEPWTGISGDPTHGGTYTPALDLRAFQQDGHRGYGGQDAAFLSAGIVNWLNTDNPDIILLKIGTNNQNHAAIYNLVKTIVTLKPDVYLIIASIMPKYQYEASIIQYNNYLRDTLVPDFKSQGKKVSFVDQYVNFLTNPQDLRSIDRSLFSNGINHPSNPGYEKMAQTWFEAIEALGLGPAGYGAWTETYPELDLSERDADADGDGLSNGIEAWLGTHPGQHSSGISELSTDGQTSTFSHPQNPSPPTQINGIYQWSPNLVDWFVSGSGPSGGPTVTLAANVVGTTATVTATASVVLPKVFLRIGLSEN